MPRKGENITKRKDGRWEARVIYAYDENHHAKYRYLYGRTYAEAKAKKEYEQAQIIHCNIRLPPNAITLQDLFSEYLFHKQSTLKDTTLAHYQNLFSLYVSKYMKGMRLLQLSTGFIEHYALDLLEQGGRDKRPLSPKTVRDIMALLRSTLTYAVRRRYIDVDILQFSMPRYSPPRIAIFSSQEQQILEQFALSEPDSFKFGIYLTLYTGLRLGELCALRWSDINTHNCELYVRRTIQRISLPDGQGTRIVFNEPKTNAGLRTIPLPAFLVEKIILLRRHVTCPDTYVLTGKEKYIEPNDYYKKYTRWLQKLDLPHHSFHTLRHTFATRCAENGFDAKSLSEILGHADVRITLNRYVHPSMELKRRHMESLTSLYLQSL